MATLPEFVAELEAKIDAIAGGSRSRMSQDYGDSTTEFSALSTTRYQIQASYLNTVDESSAAPRTIIAVEVIVHHAIPLVSGEQAYRDGQMATDQLAMIQDQFWETMATVYALVSGFPAVNELPTRVGKRVSYSIGAQLQLA